MKTAIYIEDGTTQLVLTPENGFEEKLIASFGDKLKHVHVYCGSFYDCRGGWVRQSAHRQSSFIGYNVGDCHDKSLILRVDDKPTETSEDASR